FPLPPPTAPQGAATYNVIDDPGGTGVPGAGMTLNTCPSVAPAGPVCVTTFGVNPALRSCAMASGNNSPLTSGTLTDDPTEAGGLEAFRLGLPPPPAKLEARIEPNRTSAKRSPTITAPFSRRRPRARLVRERRVGRGAPASATGRTSVPWSADDGRTAASSTARGSGTVTRSGAASKDARAAAEADLAFGSLARACWHAAATFSGTSGASCRTGGGASVTCAMATDTGVSPVKGGRPVSISKRTTPSEYTSDCGPAGLPEACSGEMYVAVPIAAPVAVSDVAQVVAAMPKSITF